MFSTILSTSANNIARKQWTSPNNALCLLLPSQSGQCNHQNHQDRSGGDGSKSLDLDRLHAENQAEFEHEKVLEAMREEYLGMNNPKKRVIGSLEKKLRFCFDWDNSDDTYRDMNALYEKPHEACLLFGRGFRAGIDRYEQKQLAAKNKEIHQELCRCKQGVKEHPEEATPSTCSSTATGLSRY